MVLTYSSNDIKINLIKNFELLETLSGEKKNMKTFFSDIATVIMFICNHCPYVQHINIELVHLANHYLSKGVSFIAINSNDIEKYPKDSPKNMKKISHKFGYPFPYFFDKKQEVAKYYGAQCTPEFFIFNGIGHLCYHGKFDDSNPENKKKITGYYIKKILKAILKGIKIPKIQKPSYGCNIKWKT